MAILTIGHSNHSLERFLDLLEGARVDAVVDTRSSPYSKYSPQFNASNLPQSLSEHGIRYAYMGKELGGRPDGAQYYDRDGRVLYNVVAMSPPFLAGLDQLVARAAGSRVALLCSEEDPSVCHRRLLIARVLHQRGVAVEHIRRDGTLIPEERLLADEAPPQMSLFGDGRNDSWKSVPSVLPKKQRNNSLVY